MPFSLFEFLFTPFGLSNVAQKFHRMMDRTINSLEALFAYINDPQVSSPDRQTHLIHLEAFFSLGHQWPCHQLLQMCFCSSTLEILGHTVSVAGSTPTAEHTAAVDSRPPPRTSS
jgi:hypothetical protein